MGLALRPCFLNEFVNIEWYCQLLFEVANLNHTNRKLISHSPNLYFKLKLNPTNIAFGESPLNL